MPRKLSDEEKRKVRMAMGERAYQFRPFTSKNIGKNLVKTGKCYNRPYVKPEASVTPRPTSILGGADVGDG